MGDDIDQEGETFLYPNQVSILGGGRTIHVHITINSSFYISFSPLTRLNE